MSSTARHCDPKFPTSRCLLDSSIVVRFFKCDALSALKTKVEGCVAGRVDAELRKRTGQRHALASFGATRLSIHLGTPEDEHLARLRGARTGTADLGELESIAIAVTAFERREVLPFACCDDRAAALARSEGVPTLDFLDTLSWLVGCGCLSVNEADAIETRARVVDGWKPEASYGGTIGGERALRQAAFIAMEAFADVKES